MCFRSPQEFETIAFDLNELEARIQLLDWRDDELIAITNQLEDAFPSLVSSIESHIAKMSAIRVTRAQLRAKTLAKELIEPWAEEQCREALARAEESISTLVGELDLKTDLGDHFHAALPALLGVGTLTASVASLPAVVSFATVTTSTLVFFSTSAVSVPLLLAGGVALTGLSLAGMKGVDYALDKSRARLALRIINLANTAVFGAGLPANSPSLITKLQAFVLRAGANKLEETS
ncbi:hypothetical protein DEM26_16535 [Thioclava sp. NG1]|uniref:hypothetical protein n=1 Tax=Thioclava sp. NG1 TaxID=2182426 RepID=UPI000D60B04B|nr:hypothetical protein [Thioclava sp. NG1]PWE48707.1 hypothetical protein DEM26_16535 [Thioclava sp. NG1]